MTSQGVFASENIHGDPGLGIKCLDGHESVLIIYDRKR
jgi:hypothetical protein